jgi:hypothetical protein
MGDTLLDILDTNNRKKGRKNFADIFDSSTVRTK